MNDTTLGYLGILVACIGFGSNYLPVKQVDVKDGYYFSFWLTVGIWIVASIQWACLGFYRFEPFAMLGGLIWSIGNAAVPYIIQRLGLGIGQLVWGSTNMLTGWAIGNFGLLGKNKDVVANPTLNYIGVAIAVLTLGFFTLMRPDEKEKNREIATELVGSASGDLEEPAAGVAGSTVSPQASSAVGLIIALAAGLFFGSSFNPSTYLQQQGQADVAQGLPPTHSPDLTHYVFSHFTGILLSTSLILGLALLVSPKKPHLGKDMVLPGLLAGFLWGAAQVGWFKANGVLSFVVCFPIVVGVPGVIAALWGLLLFGENRGCRNQTILGIIITMQAVSVTLIALSKN